MQDITTVMVIAKSLVGYRRSRSSDNEGSKDSHTTGGGEEMSPSTARYRKGKVPYNRDKGKGKGKQR